MLEENIQHQHSTCIFCKNSQRSGYLFPLLRSHRKIFVSPCDLTEQLDSFCVTWKIFFKSQSFYIASKKKIKALLIMINEENLASFAYLIFISHPIEKICCLFLEPVCHYYVHRFIALKKNAKFYIHIRLYAKIRITKYFTYILRLILNHSTIENFEKIFFYITLKSLISYIIFGKY